MRTKIKLVGAAAIVAALAAGGAAFTDSNTMPTNQHVGYGNVTVTGGTVTLDSIGGKGSSFVVELPLAGAEGDTA